MERRPPYALVYARGITDHLKFLDAKYDNLIREKIQEYRWRNGGRFMRIASVAEVKSEFSAFLKASEAGPVVVTRNGRPVAVIVGVNDDDEIERLLMSHSPRLQAIVEASRKQIREGEVLSHDQFWAEVKSMRATKRSRTKRSER